MISKELRGINIWILYKWYKYTIMTHVIKERVVLLDILIIF